MPITNLAWCVRGSIAVGAAGLLVYPLKGPWLLAPTPIFLVLLGWEIGILAFLILPAVYFVTAHYGMRWNHYPALVLGMALLFAALNIWYFVNAWSYGIKWQGEAYTFVMAALNAICFGVVIGLAGVGVAKSSAKATRIAHLALFVVVSWCAFPYLGEML